MTASKSSSVIEKSILSRRMPALFTTMSRRPNSAAARATSFSAAAQSATEEWSAIARPPAAVISATTASAGVSPALPVQPGAGVVDHDRSAVRGQGQAVRAAESAAATGHDRDLAVEQAH